MVKKYSKSTEQKAKKIPRKTEGEIKIERFQS